MRPSNSLDDEIDRGARNPMLGREILLHATLPYVCPNSPHLRLGEFRYRDIGSAIRSVTAFAQHVPRVVRVRTDEEMSRIETILYVASVTDKKGRENVKAKPEMRRQAVDEVAALSTLEMGESLSSVSVLEMSTRPNPAWRCKALFCDLSSRKQQRFKSLFGHASHDSLLCLATVTIGSLVRAGVLRGGRDKSSLRAPAIEVVG